MNSVNRWMKQEKINPEDRTIFSWKMRLKSFRFAFKGIAYMLKTQHNSWIQSGIAVIAIVMGFYLHIRRTEWLVIILAIGFVFMAELVNTAIEIMVDLVSPEKNEKAGIIKDLAAGAVLVASIMAFVAGVIIFLPKLL